LLWSCHTCVVTPAKALGYAHICGSRSAHSPDPCGRGLGGGVCARQRAKHRSSPSLAAISVMAAPIVSTAVAGLLRASRRETPPSNPRPQGAEWTDLPSRCVNALARKRGSRASDGAVVLDSRFRGNDNVGVSEVTNPC
jgi:hypothetical protein